MRRQDRRSITVGGATGKTLEPHPIGLQEVHVWVGHLGMGRETASLLAGSDILEQHRGGRPETRHQISHRCGLPVHAVLLMQVGGTPGTSDPAKITGDIVLDVLVLLDAGNANLGIGGLGVDHDSHHVGLRLPGLRQHTAHGRFQGDRLVNACDFCNVWNLIL